MRITLHHARRVFGPEGSAAVYERPQCARELKRVSRRAAHDHAFPASFGLVPITSADVIGLREPCQGYARPVDTEQFLSFPGVWLHRQGIMNTQR